MEEGVSIPDRELGNAMSKASKEAAKKKSVAQKAVTRAKKLESIVQTNREASSTTQSEIPEEGRLVSKNELELFASAHELFEKATAALKTATSDAGYSTAIDLLRQAIRLDPRQADYFASLAVAYAHTDQHDMGLAACEMALQLAPDHAVASENRRHALKALGLPDNTSLS